MVSGVLPFALNTIRCGKLPVVASTFAASYSYKVPGVRDMGRDYLTMSSSAQKKRPNGPGSTTIRGFGERPRSEPVQSTSLAHRLFRIRYGAISAQPRSNDTSNFPSLRTSSNRMAPILHHQFLKCSVHRPCLPDFANDLERHRTVLVHAVPFESNFQALRLAVVSQALNPTVVHGMVFKGQRIEQVLTIHNPVPTTGAPM
jgi:hypothetical protein